MLRLLRQFANRIAQVILITGGDFTRFCYVETADPLFGTPMLHSEGRFRPEGDAKAAFANLVHFNSLWTKACGELASAAGVPFSLADDVTFFEKAASDAIEKACELGIPHSEPQQKRFSVHRRYALVFQRERRRLAEALKLNLLAYPEPDELLFIDEFHYRAESQRLIAETCRAAWLIPVRAEHGACRALADHPQSRQARLGPARPGH